MTQLQNLIGACHADAEELRQATDRQIARWQQWLAPISPEQVTGDDPGYDDDFQQMREEVNKLSGADTALVCELAEKLLTTVSKDIRVATYYIWARLQQDGESGLADGLTLLAALLQRFTAQLHPLRDRSRKTALEWLAGQRILDTLSLYPEVTKSELERILGALLCIEQATARLDEAARPQLDGLYAALAARLEKSGGPDAVVPQTLGASEEQAVQAGGGNAPVLSGITSGRALLDQARILAKYLRDQPDGWLSSHRLLKSVRHDTLHQLPVLAANGCTRIEPPKPDQRALLKRLYLQQSWLELLEQADSMFIRGANHLWLDLQWYIHQALMRAGSPMDGWAEIIAQDLKGLLQRLPGIEGLAFNDGTPFADELTLNWIAQQVLDKPAGWLAESALPVMTVRDEDEILQLESEALQLADSEGTEAALNWLQQRPGINTARQRWLMRLLMSRVAEQTGCHEMALHLLRELDKQATLLTLTDWEPQLLFEARARRLKLLRGKAGRSEADKTRLQPEMEPLLAGLIAIDPARAAVLCG